MIPWEHLESVAIPDEDGELALYRRGTEYSMRVELRELMNSRVHHSEDALATLACDRIQNRRGVRVLIGGLGMGFTLAAALPKLKPDASVVVAELVPEVVRWNRELLGELAGHPLRDPRVTVLEQDVGFVMQSERIGFDAIMLDVDNGPEAFTRESNHTLYGRKGISLAYAALKPMGVLTVWSAKPSHVFTDRLQRQHFAVQEETLRSRDNRKGGFHTIWIAVRTS